MEKSSKKILGLIFLGGQLVNYCKAETKEEIENFVKVSYCLPHYVQYIDLDKVLNVEKMIVIDNYEELSKGDLNECELEFIVTNDPETKHKIKVSGGVVFDKFEKEIDFDLNIFREFRDLNICENCHGEGFVEVLSDCNKPASSCCGGCSEDIDCSDCEGSGVKNENF